ncbi:MAG: hypothetical protein WC551_01855 [Patescibacteria group bacterium]
MAVIEQRILDELYRLSEEISGKNAEICKYAMDLLDSANHTSSHEDQSEALGLACEQLRAMKDLPEEWAARVPKLARSLQEYADALANLAQAYRNCRM